MTMSVTRENFDSWMVPTYAPASFVPVSAEGSTLLDQSGKSYIDFAGGIAVNVLGHAHRNCNSPCNSRPRASGIRETATPMSRF